MFYLIFKRFVLGFITLFIVSLITFIGVEILPGDACTSYLEREAFGEALAACIKRLGLDVPAHESYLSWAFNVVRSAPLSQCLWDVCCLFFEKTSVQEVWHSVST